MDIIRAAGLVETPWLNGAGRKADIAAGSGWLVGLAWLETDASFSDYSGHDRTITLLEGGGFSLALPEGSLLTVERPGEPAAFDGKGPIACHLKAGPCTVLNVISAYPRYAHTVQVVGPGELDAIEPGPLVFLFVMRGRLRAGATEAGPRDTLQFDGPADLSVAPETRILAIRIDEPAEEEDDA
jgi:environmental stress-induced protein Ves